jgi:hypothetical protein
MNLLLRYIPLGLLAVLLGVLLKRHTYKIFPYFFSYVAFGVAADVTRFTARLSLNPRAYPTIYWITEAGYGVLGVLAMYEVQHIVLSDLTRARWPRAIFPAIVVASVALSLAHADAVASHFSGRLAFAAVVCEVAVRLVQVLTFALLLPLLGLGWRQYTFGIAAGFGLYAGFMLPTTMRFSNIGTRFAFRWGVISLVAYSLAVLIWIWVFSAPQKAESSSSDRSSVSRKASRTQSPRLLEVA